MVENPLATDLDITNSSLDPANPVSFGYGY